MTNSIHSPKRSFWIKLSHALLAIAVLHQLVASALMTIPWDKGGSPFSYGLFEYHEIVGIVSLGLILVLIFGLWNHRSERMGAPLNPWFDSNERSPLVSDFRTIISRVVTGDLPNSRDSMRIAHAVQGLGVLSILYMAVTGTLIAILGDDSPLAHDIAEFHGLGGVLVWTYFGGHAAMAIVHELKGEKLIRRMFGSN